MMYVKFTGYMKSIRIKRNVSFKGYQIIYQFQFHNNVIRVHHLTASIQC